MESIPIVAGLHTAQMCVREKFSGKRPSEKELLETAQEICDKEGILLTCSDRPVNNALIEATATAVDMITGNTMSTQGVSVSVDDDIDTASSEARRRALYGMFGIAGKPPKKKKAKNCISKPELRALMSNRYTELKLKPEVMSRIIKERFGKENSNELSEAELFRLIVNMEAWAGCRK